MDRKSMLLGLRIALVVGALSIPATSETATQPWVYVLSWSPQYCDQHSSSREQQCGDANYFLPRALTPESALSASGCKSVPMPTDAQVARLETLVENRREILIRWHDEGGCTDLTFDQFAVKFDYVSRRIAVPEAYQQLESRQYVDAAELRQQFVDANAGLPAPGVALHCAGKELSEVDICLSGSLTFQGCTQTKDNCEGRVMIRGARLSQFKRS